MSIATVVTRGYGSFGSINGLPTLGYTIGEAEHPTHYHVVAGPKAGYYELRGPANSYRELRGSD